MDLKKLIYRLSLSVVSRSSLNIASTLYAAFKFNKNFYKVGDLGYVVLEENQKEKVITQMQKLQKKNVIKVAIVKNKAYFVHENTFYTADIVDGEVDRASASPINAINMSKKEIENLLLILDNMDS
jgi:hypothetical protein